MINPKLAELQRLVALLPEAVVIAAEVRTIFGGIENESIALANLLDKPDETKSKLANDMAVNAARTNLKSMISAAGDRTGCLIREYRATLNSRWAAKTSPFPEVTSEVSVRMDTVYIDNLSEICTETLQAADSIASMQ